MAKKAVDKKLLKALVPISALTPQHFNEVADKIIIEDLPAGRVIFKEGERDNRTVYLLAGEISLFAGAAVVSSVVAGTDAAHHPLAPHQPRQVTARTKTPATIARIDTGLLDVLMAWGQSDGYEVTELAAGDEDWLSRMLQSQTFQRLPPANIQKLLMSMEEYPVTAGGVVIRQGDPGDYYYIIKQGRCVVTRKASPTAQEVKLAELSVGDSFGEDALISDSKRNATITMLTDGRLMRLSKKNFVALLQEPLLAQVSYAQALSRVRDGDIWLDVRLPGEFQKDHVDSALNIPLSALRHSMNELDSGRSYIVYCDNGSRSSTAAFLLGQHGYDVRVLAGGTQALSGVDLREATSQPLPAGGAEVIDFDQELQARKKTDDNAAAEVDARRQAQHAAQQLLDTTREEVDALQASGQQHIREAEQQIAAQRAEVEALLAQAREAQAQAEQARQAVTAQQSVAHAELAASHEAAQQRLTELEAMHAGSAGELARLEQTLQAERAQAQQLAVAREQSEATLQQLREELARHRREVQEAQKSRTALAQQLEAANDRLRQIEQAAQESAARAAALDSALRSGEQATQAHVQKLNAELETSRSRIDALTTQLTGAQQEAAAHLARQDEKIAAMKARLESARQQVLDAEHQKTDLEAARDAARQRAAELEDSLAQAQQIRAQLSAAEQDNARHQAARQEQERELARLRGEIEQARQGWRQQEEAQRDELAALQEQVAGGQARAQALEQARQEQAQARATLEQQLATLRDQLATAAAVAQRAEQLAAELDQLKTQRVRIEAQQQDLAADRQAAMVQVAQMRAALEAKEREAGAQAGEMQAELTRARADLERTQRASAEQSEQLNVTQVQQRQLAAERQQDAAELTRLRADLESKERELERQTTQLHDAVAEADTRLTQAQQQADARIAELAAQLDQARQDAVVRDKDHEAQLIRQRQIDDEHQAEAAAQTAQLLETLKAKTRLAEQTAEELARVRQQADERAAQSQAQLDQLQRDAAAHNKELEARLAKAQQEARSEAKALQGALDKAQAAAKAERDDLQQRIQVLQQEAEAALTRTSKQAGERLSAELARVRAELEAGQQAAQAEVAALRAALEQARRAQAEEGMRLERENSEWQARAQGLEDKLEEINRCRAAAESTAAAHEQELERLRGAAARMQDDVEALRGEEKKLRATLEETEHRFVNADNEQVRLQGLCDGLKVELQHANDQLNNALAESDTVEQERSRAENEIASLKTRIRELEDAARSENARCGKSEKKNAAELTRLRAEMAAAEEEARRHSADLQARLEHAMQQGSAADARLADQQARIEDYAAQIEQARRRDAELVRAAEEMKQQLEEQAHLRLVAENARKAAQQEADALRAETQIVRNLGGEHVEATAAQHARDQQQLIARLEDELQQAKKNVEMAVRLRGEAESTRQALEGELARRAGQMDSLHGAPAARQAHTGFSLDLRSGLGMGLAAGWVVALMLGMFLALSGDEPPAPQTASREDAPVPVAAAKPAPVPAPTAKSAPTAALKSLGTFRDALRSGGSGPLMTRLPAGVAQIGSAANSLNTDETPRHKVTLKSFAIGSYEITFDDYDRFAAATGRTLPGDRRWGRSKRPVINVSWDDAVAYTRWLSEQTGHRYRLPSEAEWEYAGGAGADTFYWWGNNSGENHAACFNCGSAWDGRQTAPVGSFAANAFGLYDTAGNVLEWVADCRHENYQGAPADGSVWSGGDCARHIARGGAYDSPADNLRIQKRGYFASATRLDNLGLRVARED